MSLPALGLDGYWLTDGHELNLIEGAVVTAPDGNRLYISPHGDASVSLQVGGDTHCAHLADGVLLWDDGDVWRPLTGDFVALCEKDAFPDACAQEMDASDIELCKTVCAEQGYGAFVVRGGRAYFRRHLAEACRLGLLECPGSDSVLYLRIGAKEPTGAQPTLPAASCGDFLDGADGDDALSLAIAESVEAECWQRQAAQRTGAELASTGLRELGLAFERQPDGSSNCAVHALNNLVQKRQEGDGYPAAGGRARADACRGPFAIEDLQMAEAESRCKELNASFVPISPQAASSSSSGMFEVEAIKSAARAKGYEVIETEPKPEWADADEGKYIDAARVLASAEESRCEPWFLGFLVYERIPGCAMHYYSILRWSKRDAASQGATQQGEPGSDEVWVLLDSLDRGHETRRNRVMSFGELVEFYGMNSEWFRSWLVRWYPIVRKSAAVTCMQRALSRQVREIVAQGDEDAAETIVSAGQAEEALSSRLARWNVITAVEQLLGAATLVNRELLVLRLSLSESKAREILADVGWDWERAIRKRADSFDSHCSVAAANTQSTQETHLALRMADWDVRNSAQLLLVSASGHLPEASLQSRLRQARAALRVSGWEVDVALSVLRLLHSENSRLLQYDRAAERDKGAEVPLEETAFALLEHSGLDEARASSLLAVCIEFPNIPLNVCAEALRRSEAHVASACELLREFKLRVRSLVAKLSSGGQAQSSSDLSELDELASLALDASEWNPGLAFAAAESFAVGVDRLRAELGRREDAARREAMAVAQAQNASEELVIASCTLADALDSARPCKLPVARLLAALRKTEMCHEKAAEELWHQLLPQEVLRFGRRARPVSSKSAEKQTRVQAPAPRQASAPGTVSQHEMQAPKAAPTRKAPGPKKKRGEECSLM